MYMHIMQYYNTFIYQFYLFATLITSNLKNINHTGVIVFLIYSTNVIF